jgi:hypothetical protein
VSALFTSAGRELYQEGAAVSIWQAKSVSVKVVGIAVARTDSTEVGRVGRSE